MGQSDNLEQFNKNRYVLKFVIILCKAAQHLCKKVLPTEAVAWLDLMEIMAVCAQISWKPSIVLNIFPDEIKV